jgi:hypothetical protein
MNDTLGLIGLAMMLGFAAFLYYIVNDVLKTGE